MKFRTTVTFDPPTVALWEGLAERWGISKSETLRRALELAERKLQPAEEEAFFAGMTPVQILDWVAAHPLVPVGWGNEFSKELREEREAEAQRFYEREAANSQIS